MQAMSKFRHQQAYTFFLVHSSMRNCAIVKLNPRHSCPFISCIQCMPYITQDSTYQEFDYQVLGLLILCYICNFCLYSHIGSYTEKKSNNNNEFNERKVCFKAFLIWHRELCLRKISAPPPNKLRVSYQSKIHVKICNKGAKKACSS